MRTLFFALLLTLSGCANFSFTENADAKLITQYATIKAIKGDPERAQRVVEIATEVQKYTSGEEFLTIDLLIGAIRNEIRWEKLDAADELLVNALLDRLRAELVERFGETILPENLRLTAETVSGWVIEAARFGA